jgi:hypothetical protein
MSVRLKLDQSGVKLSLKQWNRIPSPERRALVERPCNTAAEIEAYKQYLVTQIVRGRKIADSVNPNQPPRLKIEANKTGGKQHSAGCTGFGG